MHAGVAAAIVLVALPGPASAQPLRVGGQVAMSRSWYTGLDDPRLGLAVGFTLAKPLSDRLSIHLEPT